MNNILINGVSVDKFLGRTVNNAKFYLKTRRYKPLEGYSHERLAFLICAVEPLFQLFFSAQHFEGEYSIWVRRTLAAMPDEKELKEPDEAGKTVFKSFVADETAIDSFLRGTVPDIPMDGYVGLAGYRTERAALKAKEREPLAEQSGAALLSALKEHRLRFAPKKAFSLWKEFLLSPGRPGEDLREAFIQGGYQYGFSDEEFKKFVFGVPSCPGLNSGQLSLIYKSIILRAPLFSKEEDARRLAEVFAGPLSSHADDYAGRSKDIDLLSLFALGNPAQMKELAKSVAGDLESGWKDFFYISDYGETEDGDFEGFDEKLDVSVSFICSQYRRVETPPDIWRDKYFKFLYLMCALWFKHCYKKIQNPPAD